MQREGTKSRRHNGEGSFTKRKDGRIQGSIRVDDKRLTVYGSTRTEARANLLTKVEEYKAGKVIAPPRMTVGQYLTKYLEIRVDLKAGVHQHTTYVLRKISGVLGHVALQELCFDDILKLVLAWKEGGLKPWSIHRYFSALEAALGHAVKMRLIVANPCVGIKLPKIEKIKHRILTRAQIALVLEASKGHWFRDIFILFLATGLRKGELIALRWEDIDMQAKLLHVRRNVVWINGQGYVEDSPKTEASRRTIFLQPFALDMLRQHLLDQDEQRLLAGDRWVECGLVFPRNKGDHLRPTALNVAFAAVLKSINMDHMSVHSLRHTTATQLLSMRINPEVVKEVLGHESVLTTLIIYGHALPDGQEDALLALDNAFWGQEAKAVEEAVKDGKRQRKRT
jgi:integrase